VLEFFEKPSVVIVIVLMILVFGAKRLPDSARALGRSMRILKAEAKGLKDDDAARTSSTDTTAQTPATPAPPALPAAQTPTAQTPAAQTPAPETPADQSQPHQT
jgi:sec-independent protein translocase protein TatA